MSHTSVPRRRTATIIIAPRVKHAYELRVGYEKVPCPICGEDTWVSSSKVLLLDQGAAMCCRECNV